MRRSYFAVVVFLGLLAALHAWIGWQLLPALSTHTGVIVAGGLVLLLSVLLMPVALMAPYLKRRGLSETWSDRLAWAGMLAMGAFSSALLLWVWIVPLIIGQFFLRPYLYAEHTGCDRTRSAFQNTRTTYTGAIVKWIAWNMPYHVEHHAYPSIPFHALPKLNEIVDGEIVYRGPGYIRTTRETWAWFRRQRQRA